MVRTAFATCAGLLLPLGALACAGCGARAGGDSSAQRPAPVLLELQAMRPGPWKRLDRSSVAPATTQGTSTPSREAAPVSEPEADRGDSDGEADETTGLPTAALEPADASPAGDPVELSVPPTARMLPVGGAGPTRLPPAEILPNVATNADGAASLPMQAPVAERTQLPWARAPHRSPEMLADLNRANALVRHGFELAARGALYAARRDFVTALELISAANDRQQHTRMHGAALSAGLAALAESQSAATTDDADRQQRYALEQLAAAAAREVSGSMALFGMAKLATVHAADEHARAAARLAEARTLYQAALLAEPNNFCAASELGVLLVESGKYPAARELLIRSVSLAPHAVTWHNLAVVHARLGETQLAEQAAARAKAMEAPALKGAVPSVEWVDAQTFARTSSASENTLPAKPPVARVPVDVAKKGFGDWLPWTGNR